MTTAYAYVENGEINIMTVSPTIRAAKVNALGAVFGARMRLDGSPQSINNLFGLYAPPHGQIKRVTVEIAPDGIGG